MRAPLPALLLLVAMAIPEGSAWSDGQPKSNAPPLLVEDLLLRQTPSLDEIEDRSGVSIGTTSSGHMLEGLPYPQEGEAIRQLPTHRDRDAHYVSKNLLLLLEDVSKTLHQRSSHPLYLGDGSAKEGGDLKRHRSHNCGRDVDFALLMRDEEGAVIDPEKMERFDAEGECKKCDAQFDVSRTWTLVEALLSHDEVQVQWIFIYDPLRRAILEEGGRRGANPVLLDRASKVLRQPSDSAKHDDHIHLRVLCSERDRALGCQNRGPNWPWLRPDDGLALVQGEALLEALLDESTQEEAIASLTALELARLSPRVAALGLTHPELLPELVNILEASGVTEAANDSLLQAVSLTEDHRLQRRLLSLIAGTGALHTLPSLAAWAREESDLALGATHAIRKLNHRATAPVFIELLDHSNDEVSNAALEALSKLTNHAGPKASAHWQEWWGLHQSETRETWLLLGFQEMGLAISSLSPPQCVAPLIDAQLHESSHISLNANEVLREQLSHWMSSSRPAEERHKKWSRWWDKNEWRFSEQGE